MTDAPHAPWALRGEIVVAWVGGRGLPGVRGTVSLPNEVRPLPGPWVVVATRYTASPIGPYLELSLGVPARLGLRPGYCVASMVVSEAAAKVGSRLNWGFPAEVGRLTWSADGDERVLRWEECGIEVRGVARGPRLPVLVPTRAVQHRADGPVVVPRRVGGLLRLARVTVSAPSVEDGLPSEWSTVAGSHRGVVVSAARMLMRPSRHPSGLLSTFRAPLSTVEPGLSYRSEPAAEALQ
jgi:hypothetical protein